MTSPIVHFDPTNNKLVYNNVQKIDVKIFEQYKDTEILDLSHGLFDDLPAELANLKKLKVLFLSYGKIKKISTVVRKLESLQFLGARSCEIDAISEDCLPTNLKWITLTNNNLYSLPKSIGKLKKLQKLLLTKNKISFIPKEILQCQNLELLRISLNNLIVSPLPMLSDLPSLSWYSDSSNLYNIDDNINKLKKYKTKDLSIISTIVDSPNSRVDRVLLNNTNAVLKIFKNEFVSDGSGTNEIMINSRLKGHPNLMAPLGYLEDQGKNINGLIIEDLSNEYSPIASPPSFNTCTRDIYNGFSITKEAGQTIVKSIKDVCNHIHNLEIMHGDIYGHNIYLSSLSSQIKIGDFGAASIIPRNEIKIRRKIDIRALNIFINEINACVLNE